MIFENRYFCTLSVLFFIYSVLGWMMEVTLKYFEYGRFINRGFLVGPYCPVYGTGVVIITVLNDLIAGVDSSYGISFLIAFFFCGILEYLTGYILEKRFHARWWDYSGKPMNLNGRIWIGNLLAFGVGGMTVAKVTNPFFVKYIHLLSDSRLLIISSGIVVIMLSDYSVSHFINRLLKDFVEKSEADNSEAIAKEVRFLLQNKSVLHKRILDAYPGITFTTDRVKERLERVKEDTEILRISADLKIEEINEQIKQNQEALGDYITKRKEELKNSLSTSGQIQNEIIQLQDKLIELLMKDDVDEVCKDEIMNKISENKNRLKKRD